MAIISEACWICGAEGRTREHLSKKSDLISVYGVATQKSPVFFQSDDLSNHKINTFNSPLIKAKSPICERCNTARTQRHDRAWERLSHALRNSQPPIKPESYFRANRVFPYNTGVELLNAHLFFVKQFGCRIADNLCPIDISGFSSAILNNSPHPDMYLKFFLISKKFENIIAYSSKLDAMTDSVTNRVIAATWAYCIGSLMVQVIYKVDDRNINGTRNAWHPHQGTSRLYIGLFPEMY